MKEIWRETFLTDSESNEILLRTNMSASNSAWNDIIYSELTIDFLFRYQVSGLTQNGFFEMGLTPAPTISNKHSVAQHPGTSN